MVVLDHNGIGEREAVIVAAAAADGVTFDQAQAGRCLARVHNARPGSRNGRHILRGECSDAGHALHEVKRNTLRLEDGLGGAFDGSEDRAGGERLPVVDMEPRADDRVGERHGRDEGVFSAQDAGFARNQPWSDVRRGRNEGPRGEVPPRCVFVERHAHQAVDGSRAGLDQHPTVAAFAIA